MSFRKQLLEQTRRDVQRLNRKNSRSITWVGMLFFGGTLGLLFVVPIVIGAYFGHWLDTLTAGYSVGWTVSMIVLGIVVGGYNVFWFLQKKY